MQDLWGPVGGASAEPPGGGWTPAVGPAPAWTAGRPPVPGTVVARPGSTNGTRRDRRVPPVLLAVVGGAAGLLVLLLVAAVALPAFLTARSVDADRSAALSDTLPDRLGGLPVLETRLFDAETERELSLEVGAPVGGRTYGTPGTGWRGVLVADGDLTGHGDHARAGAASFSAGDVSCTQSVGLGGGPEVAPDQVLCWRMSGDRSVTVLALLVDPSAVPAVAAEVEQVWAALAGA